MWLSTNKRLALLIPLTFGIAFFLGVEAGGFQLVLLKIAEEFSLDPVGMGGIVTAQFIAIVMGPLLFGWVSDRIGKKTVLAYGMISFIIGCFGAFFSSTLIFFAISIFILGLGFSVCECIGSSLLSDSFPGKESTYLNIMQSGFSLGAVASPLTFNWLIQAGFVSWRMVFLSAGIGYILIYPLLILSPKTQVVKKSTTSEKKVSASKTIIFSPIFIILFFSMMIYVAVESGLAYFADSMFVTEFGNTRFGAYAISGFWLSMAVSRLAFAKIKMKPQTMVILGFLVIFFLLLFALPFKNPYIFLTVFFLLGFASGPIWPMIIGIGASLNQERSGTNTSILYASGGLGGVIIPPLIGFIAERHGFYNSFWLLTILAAIAFLIMWLAVRKQGNQ